MQAEIPNFVIHRSNINGYIWFSLLMFLSFPMLFFPLWSLYCCSLNCPSCWQLDFQFLHGRPCLGGLFLFVLFSFVARCLWLSTVLLSSLAAFEHYIINQHDPCSALSHHPTHAVRNVCIVWFHNCCPKVGSCLKPLCVSEVWTVNKAQKHTGWIYWEQKGDTLLRWNISVLLKDRKWEPRDILSARPQPVVLVRSKHLFLGFTYINVLLM